MKNIFLAALLLSMLVLSSCREKPVVPVEPPSVPVTTPPPVLPKKIPAPAKPTSGKTEIEIRTK